MLLRSPCFNKLNHLHLYLIFIISKCQYVIEFIINIYTYRYLSVNFQLYSDVKFNMLHLSCHIDILSLIYSIMTYTFPWSMFVTFIIISIIMLFKHRYLFLILLVAYLLKNYYLFHINLYSTHQHFYL